MPDEAVFPGRSPRLWLRLEQHDDKAFYANVPEVGDGILLNANLAESSAASCASFIDKMARPFAFDPVSYRLGMAEWLIQDRGQGATEKRNYARLWSKLGRGVDAWSGQALLDAPRVVDLAERDLATYARNSIDYQDRQLRDAWLAEAKAFVGIDPLFGTFAPQIYTAPYLVQRGEPAAAKVAGLLAKLSVDLARPRSVQAVLALSPDVLDDAQSTNELARSFASSGIRAAWVWTIGLQALALADRPVRFTNYARLIRLLADAGIEVGILYGGYLAALLRFVGVRAISHGLMYGEARGLAPAGGGPTATFYWPPLHRFIPYAKAAALVSAMSRAEYLERVCACAICDALAQSPSGLRDYFRANRPGKATRDFPERASLELNRFHFLMARGAEMADLRANGLPELVDQLLRAADEFGDGAREPLRNWVARLESA